LILWGFFKKVAIADRLGILVQGVYGDPRSYAGIPLIVATVAFAFQIYCDFSGYTDIAIGSARLLGFDLTLNFRQPYFSRSISEFWRRWHITLSGWFRDYVFVPLEVATRNTPSPVIRTTVSLLITMLLCGLWHGASWTFVAWGALHGGYLIADSMIGGRRDQLRSSFKSPVIRTAFDWLNVGITFCLVTIAWIPFRAANFSDAWYIFTHLFLNVGSWTDLGALAVSFRGLGLQPTELILAIAFGCLVLLYDTIDKRAAFWPSLQSWPRPLRWAVYYGIAILVLFFSPYNRAQNFIYFQF
jgi:D-alanyl-lipoteichoic acid acyltransferase DltB (MBOAT superfamily)